MDKQFVEDLAENTRVASCFVVKQKALVPFRNKPGKFLDVALADRTGEIKGRVWDDAPQAAEQFDVGDIVFVEGAVEEYRGQLQIIAARIEGADDSGYEIDDMIMRPGRPKQQLLQWLEETIQKVEHPQLRALLDAFFGDEQFKDRFAVAFGAKILHHSYPGGLLEHTLSVVQILLAAAQIHPELNRDLLITGALLHDVGKIEELEGTAAADYTDAGRFIGHTVLGDRMIMHRISQLDEFDPHLQRLLSHMILSHHGQRDWGAPITPTTREACALHYADNLDARVQGFKQVIDAESDGGASWSEYHRLYETRIFLGPTDVGEAAGSERAETDAGAGSPDQADSAMNSQSEQLPL